MVRTSLACLLMSAQAARIVQKQNETAGNHNPVIEVFMYRGKKYGGTSSGSDDSEYALENVDVADLPGVLQYIHREIITEHQIGTIDAATGKTRTDRKYDISHIMQYRVLVKNPVEQSGIQQDFHGYETYDWGQATNTANWNDLSKGDHVGAQVQSNKYVPFNNPYYWFSFSGFCPNLPFKKGAITAICKEDQATKQGTCSTKEGVVSNGCSSGSGDVSACLCYEDMTQVVKGGLCGGTGDGKAPSTLAIPTGQRGCTYSYENHGTAVSMDELTGITKEDCGGRLCKNYADFRENCSNDKYRQYFSPMGRKKRAGFCVEYDLHPDCATMGCDSKACQSLPKANIELGLPFWQGRCVARRNTHRAEQAAKLFGVEGADTKHVVTMPASSEYANVACDRKNLNCRPNSRNGESHCTRAWSGVCTACRVPGFQSPNVNKKTAICPWTIMEEYPATKPSVCKTRKASDLCCLYLNSCSPAGEALSDDGLAEALFTQDTEKVQAYLTRIATGLISVPESEIEERAAELKKASYWAWGRNPSSEYMEGDRVSIHKAAGKLNWVFPGSKVYTTTTTTTILVTTTRRTFAPMTTRKRETTTEGEMHFDCICEIEDEVNGVFTGKPGCAAHLGRNFGPFCYIAGDGNVCKGMKAKFSKKVGLWYRPCDPEVDMGAP